MRAATSFVPTSALQQLTMDDRCAINPLDHTPHNEWWHSCKKASNRPPLSLIICRPCHPGIEIQHNLPFHGSVARLRLMRRGVVCTHGSSKAQTLPGTGTYIPASFQRICVGSSRRKSSTLWYCNSLRLFRFVGWLTTTMIPGARDFAILLCVHNT